MYAASTCIILYYSAPNKNNYRYFRILPHFRLLLLGADAANVVLKINFCECVLNPDIAS